MYRPRFDALAFVALFLIFFMGFKVFTQRTQAKSLAEISINIESGNSGGQVEVVPEGANPGAAGLAVAETDGESQELVDNPAVIAPYDSYVVTQGEHGASYGHRAVDLAAGKGATIYAPISGKVSDLYVDEWGNPTLVLENKDYQVTLLHGIYNVTGVHSRYARQFVRWPRLWLPHPYQYLR
jgi:murein DD-endopeptidase MepM/ murein hydrolase activator NlpD